MGNNNKTVTQNLELSRKLLEVKVQHVLWGTSKFNEIIMGWITNGVEKN
jgi:hypothetical protein